MWDMGWRQIEEIDAALAQGRIDQQGWHDAMANLLREPYLTAETPWQQSGKGGTAEDWEQSRKFVLDPVDRDGTLLDVGCANGYLMECIPGWAAEKGLNIEPHGVDIVPEFVALARKRLPQWADRIHEGNALTWTPPQRYDFVRTGLEYVPADRRRDFVAKLLTIGDRLIVGPYTVDVGDEQTENDLADWGFTVAGHVRKPHPNPRGVRTLCWLDQS
ncbi:hypothetical protein BCF44_11878 [Kutzneria buriramensis]|uniref:Methyltransferase family protein n=2 Tax=Kutzneria buriramensis TaxID=1045776 RepID=A0A3E0GYH7_9PSEU|nr:hypothetical protein BCF44_11878 [Kutzneria buriramensis]